MERAMYNGASSGISLDGTRFFYVNPLVCYPAGTLANGKKHITRPEWFTCSCGPPNIARLRASAGQYFYDYNDTTIWVNLYNDCVTDIKMQDHCITLTQTTDYPWDGKVNVNIQSARPVKCEIAFRVPDWCHWFIALNSWGDELYSPQKPGTIPCKLKAVPYFCWSNRNFGEMQIWIRQ